MIIRIGRCLGRVAQKAKPVRNAWALALTIVSCAMGRVLLGPRFQMWLDVVVIAVFVVQCIYVYKDHKSWAPKIVRVPFEDSEYANARHLRFLHQRRLAEAAAPRPAPEPHTPGGERADGRGGEGVAMDDQAEAQRQRIIARLRVEAALQKQGLGGWEKLEPGVPCVLKTTAEVPGPFRRLVQPLVPESRPARVQ